MMQVNNTCAAGKIHEFEGIYREYRGYVLEVARKYSRNIHDAEDIMQETFIAFYKDMQKKELKGEGYRNIKTWLSVATKNKALNLLRKRGKIVLLEDLSDLVGVQCVAIDSAEEDYIKKEGDAERKEFCRNILKALKADNFVQYEAVVGSCYLKLTSAEIAERNGANKACIDTKIYRARQKIRKRYIDAYNKLKYA